MSVEICKQLVHFITTTTAGAFESSQNRLRDTFVVEIITSFLIYLGCEGVRASSSRTLLLEAQRHIDCFSAAELLQILSLVLRHGGHDKILQGIHRRGDVVHRACQYQMGKRKLRVISMKVHRNSKLNESNGEWRAP